MHHKTSNSYLFDDYPYIGRPLSGHLILNVDFESGLIQW